MKVYYNEIDEFCCAWLQNLMDDGLITPGKIDNRDIWDIIPEELAGYERCHFFAGIGIWDLALGQAGWPIGRTVWTGSCPCQPFSAAGKGAGFADERHLWPAFFHLIQACRPQCVLGEQVASKDGLAWLDLVQTDLEGADYASGAVDICAAGFGAPHIRQRSYWVAYSPDARRDDSREYGGGPSLFAPRFEQCGTGSGMAYASQQDQGGRRVQGPGEGHSEGVGTACERFAGLCATDLMGNPISPRLEGWSGQSGDDGQEREAAERTGGTIDGMADAQINRYEGESIRNDREPQERIEEISSIEWLAITDDTKRRSNLARGDNGNGTDPGWSQADGEPGASSKIQRTSPTNGLWRYPDWLYCRDNKWRPVEPATFPLAPTGTFRNRVAELRGAGNAVNLAQASEFVKAVMGELSI